MSDDKLILAIESSADETSAAVVKNGSQVLSNVVATQIASHQRFGGIVPEVASRHHIEWITKVIDEALKNATITQPATQLSAVAATYGPGLVGSLLVGLMSAKSLSLAYNLPFIGVNHLAGHIMAARFVKEIQYPSIALMVSGGHTQIVLLPEENQYEVLGETLDDAAGEAFDKVGRILGLNYPAGKQIQDLAQKGNANIDFPIAHTKNTFDFSFSGLKSSVANYVEQKKRKQETLNLPEIAASFQNAVVKALIDKVEIALDKSKPKQLLLAGGVAANGQLRQAMQKISAKKNIELLMVPIEYAGDNAAMIGAQAYLQLKNKKFSSLNLNTDPGLNF